MSDYIIETDDLWMQFGSKLAIKELNLRIIPGGIHSIVGSNGAGKSTLFKLLLGVLAPSRGSCRVLGEDSLHLSPKTRGKIGFVNEEHTLPRWMTVKSLLKMQKHFYPEWDDKLYEQVIGNFNVSPKQKVGQLSRGERAGFNLAMTLAQRPSILILDEPTLGLDVVAKQAFLESLLFSERVENSTIIYCSHQMDEVERVADHLIVMEQGEIVNVSAPDDFCERIHYWVVKFKNNVKPSSLPIPGLLQQRVIDDEHHFMVIDQDEKLEFVFEAMGAVTSHRAPVNLTQAVNGFLSRNHHRPASTV